MQYIYDSEAVSKLIEITEEIYLRYIDIIDVKSKDDNYYYLIGELTRLSKIEDELLLSFPKTCRLLDDVNNSIRSIYKCDNYLMYNFVLNRIDSNICNLCALAENDELSILSNVSLIDSQDNINYIYDELYFNYILRLNNVIDSFNDINDKRRIRFIQLAYIFSLKNISDAFINNNFCLEKDLIIKKEESFDNQDLYNSFIYLKNSKTFDLCESLLMRIISLSSYYNEEANHTFYLSNILLFKSLLQDLNDPDFMEFRSSFMIDFDSIKNENFIICKLKSCFDLEYNRRFSLEKNEMVQSIDEGLFNNLITLLKLEDSLYDKIMSLKLDGCDNFNAISSLFDFEKELINEIDVNKDNVSVINFVINRDLDFFVNISGDLFKKNAIISRLKNSFDFFKKYDLAEGIVENNYYSIISNHIVDSLKKFDGDLFIIKYYLFMYPSLTFDLILTNGNYLMIERFSDDITSRSLGNNSVYDYNYDKNEQLYKLFTYLIDDLIRYSDLYESEWISLFNFKICELSDIIDCVSDEHLCQIKDEISSLDDGMIKKRILSLFGKKVH